MRHSVLPLLLLASSLAFSQAAPSSPSGPVKPLPPENTAKPSSLEASPQSVVPNAPVITLPKLCDPGAPPRCKKVITKAEFETIVDAINPEMPPAGRRSLATQYARVLATDIEAAKLGLEQDPKVQEMLRLARMQVLAQELTKALQKKFKELSPQELQSYYNDNKPKFEEVTLRRVMVPKPAPTEAKPAEEAAVKATAEKVRARAAAGEDLDKLQKEVSESASNKTATAPGSQPAANIAIPATNLGPRRRGSLPLAHEQVFDLQPGEVSQPLDDMSGYYIYKVESKRQLPLDDVKAEIERTLQGQKMQDAMQAIAATATPELNETYFGPASAGAMPGMSATPQGRSGAAKPPASSVPAKPAPRPPSAPPKN